MRAGSLEALTLLALSIAPAVATSEPARPRGVGPEFAKFYKVADKFNCISNPSIQIPFDRVNDDYCDCPDGSDEPGTSACSYLSPLSPAEPSDIDIGNVNTTAALPGFYCKNKGHQPNYIPSTYVNDGICDYELCCDGSDEYEGVGGVKCEDRCKEIGKEWRKQDEQRQRAMGAANKRRKELVTEASRLRKEVEDRIQTLQSQIAAMEVKVSGLEDELKDIQRKEKGKVVKGQPGKGGKLSILVGLTKDSIDELKQSLSRVREERDTSRQRLKELEEILADFKEEYNPNFNDAGVKRAVQRWEDYAARDKGPDPEPALDRDLDALLQEDSESSINWDDFTEAEENETDVLYQFEEYLPKPLRDWVDQKLRDLRVFLIDNGMLAAPSQDGEPKAVTDARHRLTTGQNELRGNQNELKSHQDDLEKDYGPGEVFRALKGQCVEKDSGEYIYEFCFMDKTTQKPKKGGAHTNMGKFTRVDKVVVDEDLPPDGKGLGSGERLAMKFENGQHCWNGPNRSTTVILACAEKDEIWKVVEEEKCVYRMEVGTPAVCTSATDEKTAPAKDEL